jgi:hypothetical protein
VVNTQARGAPPAILLIIGVILAAWSIQATTPYKAFLTGDFKAYTACAINALKTAWEWLQAWPRLVIQGLGWW